MNVLGHPYFARSLRKTSQIKFKDNMAPTVAKFGLTLKTGADGTAGAREDGSPAAAKCQKTAGSVKLCVSANFDGLTRRSNPPPRGGSEREPPKGRSRLGQERSGGDSFEQRAPFVRQRGGANGGGGVGKSLREQ